MRSKSTKAIGRGIIKTTISRNQSTAHIFEDLPEYHIGQIGCHAGELKNIHITMTKEEHHKSRLGGNNLGEARD